MLKKVMFWLMSIYSATRFLGLSYTISTHVERLPVPVYVAAGLSALVGIFLLCKRIVSRVKMRELEVYYLLAAVAALFNLIFVKYASRIEATPLDFLVIGTAADIVLSVALIVLSEKERKYVKISVRQK